jgi:tRNA pseudouridine55 synthase
VLLLDKPSGLTSNAALQAARRLLRAQKAGHGGTLDPLASGLLPILFGEATKFAGYLLDADKEYVARVALGARTATGDAEGEVIECRPVTVTDAQIEGALEAFRGKILQVPPMYSALKRGGQPLYRLARAGHTLDIEPRAVHVRLLELRERRGDVIELHVVCSKGTYVRKLAEDIGGALGTGAHLAGLRRTAAGGFRLEDATSIEALQSMTALQRDRALFQLDRLLSGIPRVDLDFQSARKFGMGQIVAWTGVERGLCAVYRPGEGGFIGVGEADGNGGLRPRRLTAQSSRRDATG